MAAFMMLFLLPILLSIGSTEGEVNRVTGMLLNVEKNWNYITWNKNTDTITHYQLEYNIIPEVSTPKRVNIPASQPTAYNITDLESGTAYNVRLRAGTTNELSMWTTNAAFLTKGYQPVKYIDVTDIADVTTRVEWAPKENSAPQFYQLRLIENQGEKPVTTYPKFAVGVNSYTLTNLKPASPYIIEITTITNNEESSIKSTGFRTGLRSMQPVEGLRATNIVLTSVILNWNKPIDTKYIQYYEIELTYNGTTNVVKTFNEETLDHTQVKSLLPATIYYARIRTSLLAEGTELKGRWTNKIVFITAQPVQLQSPTNMRFNPSKIDVIINWEKPTGVPTEVQFYRIQYGEGFTNIKSVDTESNSLQFTLRGLMSGSQYNVRIQAIDIYGIAGKLTVWATFLTTGPKPVSSVTITEIKATSVRISWTVYSDAVYDSITVRLRNNEQGSYVLPDHVYPKGNTTRSVTLTGLMSSHPYSVLVHTTYQGVQSSTKGNGFRSDSSTGSIVPQNVQVSLVSGGNVVITSDKVNAATQYQVEVMQLEPVMTRTKLFAISTGTRQTMNMAFGTGYSYSVRVRAQTSAFFYSAWSSPPATITIAGGRKPQSMDVYDITDLSFKVTWLDAYKHPVVAKYVVTVEARGNLVERKEIDYKETPVTFNKGIISNEAFTIKVQAKSPTDGTLGDTLMKTIKTPKGTPNQPFFTNVVTTKFDATLTWQKIPDRDDIIYYEIELSANYPSVTDVKTLITSSGDVTSFKIPDVKPRVLYSIRVRGVTAATTAYSSKGFYSTLKLFSVIGDIPGPKVTSSKVDGTSVLIKWDAGETHGILHYEIEVTTLDHSMTTVVKTSGVTETYNLEDLHPQTSYKFRIRAIVVDGAPGAWSADQQMFTGGKKASSPSTSSGLGTGEVAGIIVAVILLLIILVVAVMICRKKAHQSKFDRFDNGSVKFSKNGHSNGTLNTEMDERAATAIKPNGAHYT